MVKTMRRWCALLCALSFVGLSPLAAEAQSKKRPPPPEITAFELEPVPQVAAGTELFFRLTGTPGGRASVKVGGVNRTLVLEEVDDGVYEGGYTLRATDKASLASSARATLRVKGRSSTVTMARLGAAPPQAQQAPPQQQAQQQRPLAINRFSVAPVAKLEPGEELKFQLEGTPGARVSFTIENVAANVPMREVAPGRYEGAYTIRRLDKLTGGVPIFATLEAGGQGIRTNLNRASVLADTRPPAVRNTFPRDGDTVPAGTIAVSGTFDDRGGVGVDPKTVKLVVGGRDVTANATITPQSFTYRAELGPGTYAADVSARDVGGNAVRQAWTFTVQAPTQAALLLEVTSHAANAVVPRGPLEVRGRTAPGARVNVDVVGLANVAGLMGLSQPLYKDTLTADASGNFRFNFTPQFSAPGLRYEIDLKAEDGQRAREQKLVLFVAR